MDDLDHSMHISEYDWTSFYEESEECGLLQPLLACPDSSSLSDSEDSGNSSSVFSVGYTSGQISCSGTGGGQLDHSTEVHITTTLQTELNVHSSDGESTELQKEDAEMQMESDSSELTSTQEADPLPCNRTELNANELHASDRAESEDARGFAVRAEKERWFVTVNDSPARQRVPSTSVKKKRRPKKTRKGDHMFKCSQERSLGNSFKLEIMRDNNESEGGMEAENSTQVNQNFGKEAIGSAEKAPESIQMGGISDSSGRSLMSSNKEEVSEKLEVSNSPKDDSDPVTDTSSHCVLTPKEPSRLDSVESDELEDAVEFLSTHSFDSESYLSATESVEELLHLLMENQQLQSSLSVTESSSNNETAANFEGHGNTDVQPTLTFPSAAQSANKMPDDNATCDNDTHGVLSADTRGFQRHEANLSASVCSSGVQLPPVPDLTVTPRSVVDSPETYAKAEGHLRPVYAISAFWDEMEKLTINDILQLRMGRRETQHTATPDVDGHSCLVDTLECNSSDGGLMDTSDTADSDYFTQPDESKPDRSSCEFSTSEFEEEYWQFLGTSRNSSPNPQSEIQLSTTDFSSLAHEDKESTSSEGKETPVPSEDFMRKCFEDHNSNDLSSSKLVWPRKMTKSKSVHNVQALNTEDLSLQLLLGNDEGRLLLSSCPPLEDNMVLKANDSLATLTSAPFPDELSFPEKSEYFFREEKAGSDSQWVTVYEPQELSVFDYPLCTFRDEMSFFSLNDFQHSWEKPIPIFSCSHPTVRELTFPNPDYIFLDANCEQGDAISPIRVVSCSFIQGGGFHSWKSLMRMIRFPVKGSLWCRRSGAWAFPVEAERILVKSSDLPVLTEGRVSLHPSQLFGELVVQQRVLEAMQTTRREGIFSTLRQSDMCLVCIAFASWVLKSSDPEAADAWKAALLANVSALSAIQYLRQYVRRKKPS